MVDTKVKFMTKDGQETEGAIKDKVRAPHDKYIIVDKNNSIYIVDPENLLKVKQ